MLPVAVPCRRHLYPARIRVNPVTAPSPGPPLLPRHDLRASGSRALSGADVYPATICTLPVTLLYRAGICILPVTSLLASSIPEYGFRPYGGPPRGGAGGEQISTGETVSQTR